MDSLYNYGSIIGSASNGFQGREAHQVDPRDKRYSNKAIHQATHLVIRLFSVLLLTSLITFAKTAMGQPPMFSDIPSAIAGAWPVAPAECKGKALKPFKGYQNAYTFYQGNIYLSLRDPSITPQVQQALERAGYGCIADFGNHFYRNILIDGYGYSCVEPQIVDQACQGRATMRIRWGGAVDLPPVFWLGGEDVKIPKGGTALESIQCNGKTLHHAYLPPCQTRCQSRVTTLQQLKQTCLEGNRPFSMLAPSLRGPGVFLDGFYPSFDPVRPGYFFSQTTNGVACRASAGAIGAGLVTGYAASCGAQKVGQALGMDPEDARILGTGVAAPVGLVGGEFGASLLTTGRSCYSGFYGSGGLAMSGPLAGAAVATDIIVNDICKPLENACNSAALQNADKDTVDNLCNTVDELTWGYGLGSFWFGIKYWTGYGPRGGIGGGW